MTNSPWTSKGNCKPPTWTAPSFMDTVKVLALPFLLQVQCKAESGLETKMHLCNNLYILVHPVLLQNVHFPLCMCTSYFICLHSYKSKYSITFPSGRRQTASTIIDHTCWRSGVRTSVFFFFFIKMVLRKLSSTGNTNTHWFLEVLQTYHMLPVALSVRPGKGLAEFFNFPSSFII